MESVRHIPGQDTDGARFERHADSLRDALPIFGGSQWADRYSNIRTINIYLNGINANGDLSAGEKADRSPLALMPFRDRKSTRLNSSHRCTSYAVLCLKKKSQPPGLLPHATDSH